MAYSILTWFYHIASSARDAASLQANAQESPNGLDQSLQAIKNPASELHPAMPILDSKALIIWLERVLHVLDSKLISDKALFLCTSVSMPPGTVSADRCFVCG